MAAEADKIVKSAIIKAEQLRKRGKHPEAAAQLAMAANYAKGRPDLKVQIQEAQKGVS